ncbi:PREDICTED: activating transcription factor 7-interacting protein 2 [Crocodylus porosus]|uniref:Activating transcription factor 7 interacting protein 2 n=1 Tax=Crocodylus porosus TaxID=8502 RepID=A0A7M4E7B9_CROPO|nr:PREDICTED: activating transcription factor 7-interacting protein 2 [Crocodylus porosus]
MEPSNMIIRKPWRARKTMTQSSRKQVKMLNKIKTISGQEKFVNLEEDHSDQLNSMDVSNRSNDTVKERSLSKCNITKTLPEKCELVCQTLMLNLETDPVNLEVNTECSYDKNINQNRCKKESQDPTPEKSCNKICDAKQFLSSGCLQDILDNWHENELTSPSSKPVEVHLYSQPNGLPVELKRSTYLKGKASSVFEDERTNGMNPDLEETDTKVETNISKKSIPTSERTDTMEDSNNLKHENNISSVTPTRLETDKTDFESKMPYGNGYPNVFEDDKTDLKLQDMSPESNFDTVQRKRLSSGNKEDFQCKRIKTSDEINEENICTASVKDEKIWEKVKLLIYERMGILNDESFNHKIERLNGRVEQTQCRRKHEEIAITFLKKISKLERRINAVITFQKKILTKTVTRKENLQGANLQNVILNRTKGFPLLPDNSSVQSVSPVKAVPAAHRQSDSTPELVSEDGESSDEVILISVESKNSTAITTTSNSDTQKKDTSTQAAISAKTQLGSKIAEKNPKVSVIDLTEEEKHHCNKGKVNEKQKSMLNKTVSKPGNPKLNRLELPEQTSCQALEHFSHLPPFPRIPPYPKLTDEFKDTPPPQKPELKLAQVQNPAGIALSWTVTEIDPKCAPIESYHLFLFHESSNHRTVSQWKKIGEIKALPLPMACSLSQFTVLKKYYFTIQAKDVCGRYGPFCDIQSITLFPLETLTKDL